MHRLAISLLALGAAAAFAQDPAVLGIMRSRTPGQRGRALPERGATGGDAVVMRALRWLRTVQNEDGSWPGNPVSETALALWTYLDHHEVPAGDTEFGPTVGRGLRFLVDDLDPETGLFRSAGGDPLAQPLGAFAIALGYAMDRSPALHDAGPAAFRPLLAGQRPDGAWNADPLDPSPKGRGDPRMTAVCSLVLRGARQWRGDVASFAPDESLARATGALLAFLDPVKDVVTDAANAADPATAAVVFALQRLGRHDDPAVRRAVGKLAACNRSCEAWDGPQLWRRSKEPLRDWFYVTNVKFQDGGRTFADWNKQSLPSTIRSQTVVPAEESGYSDLSGRGRDLGYWDSPSEGERAFRGEGAVLACRRWRDGECFEGETTLGDRVRDTCLASLPMMVYYAFLPASGRFGLDDPTPAWTQPPNARTNRDVHVNVTRRRQSNSATFENSPTDR